MRSKIFKSILSVAIAVLLSSLVIIIGVLYPYFGGVQESQLKDELNLAADATEQLGESYLEGLDYNRYRLTWVDADGTVIFDSHADAVAMENHADREEIKEALVSGTGSSTRQSSTLTDQTIYEATRLNDGSVLRISVSQATVLTLIAGIAPWFVLAALLAAVLSWLLAKHLSGRIITPLNQVDLEHPLENDTYEELSPLLSKIHRQHEQINAHLLQLRQKTDEFEQITASMKEGLVLLNAKGKILSINPAAAALFGAAGNSVGVDFLAIERSHKMNRATTAALETGHTSIREERGGRSYQLDISRIESAGKVMGLVILAFDVSEREYAERTRGESFPQMFPMS